MLAAFLLLVLRSAEAGDPLDVVRGAHRDVTTRFSVLGVRVTMDGLPARYVVSAKEGGPGGAVPADACAKDAACNLYLRGEASEPSFRLSVGKPPPTDVEGWVCTESWCSRDTTTTVGGVPTLVIEAVHPVPGKDLAVLCTGRVVGPAGGGIDEIYSVWTRARCGRLAITPG